MKPTIRHQKIHQHHRKRKVIVFGSLVVLLVLAAVFARYLCPYDPYAQELSNAGAVPSLAHPFGTDRYGRDMLSRVIMGAQVSIFSTLALVGFIAAVGTLAGILCAMSSGWVDSLIMRLADVCLAFPGLVLAMAVAAVLGGGVQNAVIALALIGWPRYARIARSNTLSLLEMDYMKAARLAGDTGVQLIYRHILPGIASPIIVTAVLDIGTQLMELAGLSFLGLGARPPIAEWGSMINDSRNFLLTQPWVTLSPGIGIFLTVSVFNLFGDALRDYLDPRGED